MSAVTEETTEPTPAEKIAAELQQLADGQRSVAENLAKRLADIDAQIAALVAERRPIAEEHACRLETAAWFDAEVKRRLTPAVPVPADRAASAALTPPQDEPTPERRREMLNGLTAEAIEAGSYGEPAPEMGFCADCGVPTQQMRHREHCPQGAPDDALSAPTVVDYSALRGKAVIVYSHGMTPIGGVLTGFTQVDLFLDVDGKECVIARTAVKDVVPVADPILAHLKGPDASPIKTLSSPEARPEPEAEDTSASTETGRLRALTDKAVDLAHKVLPHHRDGQPTDTNGDDTHA